MLIAAAFAVCVLTVPFAGGRLGRLAELRLRHGWLIFSALAVQLALIYLFEHGPAELLSAAHMTSYVMAGAFFFLNRALPGLWVIAAGGGLNFAAIIANGGTMPATPDALAEAGLDAATGGFETSQASTDSPLWFLGDIFAVPSSFPLHNVFSLGDLCIVAGAAVFLHRFCGSRLVPSGEGEFRALLAHRPFVRVWVAQAASNLGDWLYSLAVVATLAQQSVSAGTLATLLLCQVAPAAVVGALGGPLVDRLSRKCLMVGADVMRGTAVASLILVGDPSLTHLYAVAGCLGFFGALFQPSLAASLPNLVPRRRLVAANALVSSTFHLAIMIGPFVGGLLAGGFGITVAFWLNAASFALSATLLLTVRIPRPEARKGESPVHSLAQGFRYSLATPLVRSVMILTGLMVFAGAIRSPVEPLFVFGSLGNHAEGLGLAAGVWGAGMLLGSGAAPAACRRWPREHLFAAMLAVIGGCLIAASFMRHLPPVLLLWLVAGFGNAIANVSYESLLQERTPDRLRGRVVAASESVLDAAIIIGALSAASIAGALGVRGTYALAGLLFVAVALLTRVMLRPHTPRPKPVAPVRHVSALPAAVGDAPRRGYTLVGAACLTAVFLVRALLRYRRERAGTKGPYARPAQSSAQP
jgi:MFS family permease